jgi:hypothetical protein
MRYITTSHYRLINLAVLLLLLVAGLNAVILDSAFLPAYKEYFLCGALVINAANLLFVKPSTDVGPLRVPRLSVVQIRIVTGALGLACMFFIANYYFFEPGLFAPYKKQALVAAFAIMGLFVVLYSPVMIEWAENASASDDRGA